MRFNPADIPFLTGESYSNGRQVRFIVDANDRLYRSRADLLVEMSGGRRIVHVGCVDHDVASIDHKIRRGKWLHKQLVDAADRCFGVDINEAGIAYMRDVLGYADVAVADVTTDPGEAVRSAVWDYLLIPEVLEHIDDPVAFLKGVRKQFADLTDRVVVTVPNAFSRDNFRAARSGFESINSDHRYWFTPYTLAKVAMQAGFAVERFSLCRHGMVKKRSLLKNAWFRRYPLLRSDIVMTLSFGD